MVFSLTYRRPDYVDQDQYRNSLSNVTSRDESSMRSGQSGASAGIPDALKFDRIMDGGTCPPCTVRDFMNYLIYIEHAAENLQFFLWYRDYVKRFHEANTSDTKLAPEWTQQMENECLAKLHRDAVGKAKPTKAGEIFKGTDFENDTHGETFTEKLNPFGTPPQTAASLMDDQSTLAGSNATSYKSQAREAYTAVGAKQPFTIQPFRTEISRVLATYITDDAPRQLNLSARERKVTIQALAYTTHPSAFRTIARSVEQMLRKQAHPNFIRWSICNGNPARVTFARALGVGLITISTVVALILTLSNVGRGWRALAAIGWVLGISTLIAAYKGMCVVLHGMHHRHIRPWELFVEDSADFDDDIPCPKASFESFGSTNSYEDEPWIVKYQKRNMVRKIFDREVWIQEPALRQIQDTIFLQAMLGALVGAGLFCAIFIPVPNGNFF